MGFKIGRPSVTVEAIRDGEKTPTSTPTSGRTSPTLNLDDGIETQSKEAGASATQLPALETSCMQTPAMKRKAWLQFSVLCLSIYVSGWNDGALGPLLPRLQDVYHVSICTLAPFLVLMVFRLTGWIRRGLSHLHRQLHCELSSLCTCDSS